MSSNPAPAASAGIFSDPRAAPRGQRKWLKRFYRNSRHVLLPALLLAVLLIVWQAGTVLLNVPVYLLPAPTVIAADLVKTWGSVSPHLWATLFTVLAGFLLSIVVAMPLAALLTYSSFAAAAIYPLLTLTQSVPKVALAPILVLLLGTNALPKIIIAFMVAFFPLLLSAAAGLAATPPELIELGRSLKASPLKEFLRIRLPFAVPFVFSGLKVAITFSVIGAVVGEFVAADQGLGYWMVSSLAFFNTPSAFGAIVLLSFMGIVLFQSIVLIERVLFPWASRSPR